MSNFAFLQTYWPDFAKIMEFAENYVYTDPASSKNKSGLFVELMVREIFRIEKIEEPQFDNTHYTRTKLLNNDGILPDDINRYINHVRKKRNTSTHENSASEQEALSVLGFTHHIAVWFMQVYGDGNFREKTFVKPEPPKTVPDYTRLVLNQERKIAEQKAQIEQLTKEREANRTISPQSALSKQERRKTSDSAISKIKLTEAETRELIDEQLRKVGWEVDSKNLRYSKGKKNCHCRMAGKIHQKF